MITKAELRGEVIITSFLRGVYPLKNPSWHCIGTISEITCHKEYYICGFYEKVHDLAIFGGYAAVLLVWPEGIPKKSEC